MTDQSYEMHLVAVEELYDLRRRLLRPDGDENSVHFHGDADRYTLHIALYLEGQLIGCASLMRSACDASTQPRQYQLRGMAVETQYQRMGYGNAIIKYCEFLCLNRAVPFLWCNARLSAQGFYAANGFSTYGEPFYIAPVCDHIIMYKKVTPHRCGGCHC